MGFSLSGFSYVIFMSAIMAVSTYFFGVLPLRYKLEDGVRQDNSLLAYAQRFGALSNGIIAGTAFVIVIPEGIESLYNASPDSSMDHHFKAPYTGFLLLLGFFGMYLSDNLDIIQRSVYDSQGNLDLVSSEREQQAVGEIIEQLETLDLTPQQTGWKKHLPQFQLWTAPIMRLVASNAILVALLIHSFADGLALSVSSLSKLPHTSLLLYISVILHKLPVGFSVAMALYKKYTSLYCIHSENQEQVENNLREIIKGVLMLFAAATPIAAILMYFLLIPMGQDHFKDFYGATMLLISGGAFVYLAMHFLSAPHKPDLTVSEAKLDIMATTVGMFIPCLVSLMGSD